MSFPLSQDRTYPQFYQHFHIMREGTLDQDIPVTVISRIVKSFLCNKKIVTLQRLDPTGLRRRRHATAVERITIHRSEIVKK